MSHKGHKKNFKFNVVSLYPSFSKKIFDDSVNWAKQFYTFTGTFSPSSIDKCVHIESNNYKMFNRQIRFKNKDNYFWILDFRVFFIFNIFCIFELSDI